MKIMEHPNQPQTKTKYGVAVVRVSSEKQGLQGDSTDDQRVQISRRVEQLSSTLDNQITIEHWFEFIQSASGEIEMQPLNKAIDYCRSRNGEISYFFVKSIDRVTRAGSSVYNYLKSQLASCGTKIIDVQGIIGTQEVNTLEHLGIEYPWSSFNPTWTTELLEAERSKGEVRDILTRMIGAEVRYVRMGYRVRAAPMGFVNEKVETQHGMRVILKPHHNEANWIIRMYELRAQRNLTDDEIVKQVNLLGFRSRNTKRHNPNDKTQVIGERGGKPLTVKQLQRYIQCPIYAGVNAEKWTEGKPVKTLFDGLISIELFNKANNGKITIVEEGDSIVIFKGKLPDWRLRKKKDNPDFPYKKYVSCPKCNQPLLGSAPKSKSGKHIPIYHCARKHKYWGVNKKVFDKVIEDFVTQIRFSNQFKKRFTEIVLEEWEKRERNASNDTVSLNKRLVQIEEEIQLLKGKIRAVSRTETIQMFEEDISKLVRERVELIQKRDTKEDEQVKIETLMNYVRFYMEHLHKLLLEGSEPLKNAAMFGLVFDERPTYVDLINGTPKLAPLFKLNQQFNTSQNQFVSPEGFEPSTNRLKVCCSAVELWTPITGIVPRRGLLEPLQESSSFFELSKVSCW